MNLRMLKYYLLGWALLLSMSASYGQSVQENYLNSEIEERNINAAEWKTIIEGINYNQEEKKKVEDYDEDFSSSPSSPSSSSRSYSTGMGSGSFWSGFFKFILILIVLAALIMLAAHFMGAGSFIGPTNRRISRTDNNITIENIEDHIYESDLDRFIREAAEGKQYALAIRLYYLAIIKELSLNKTIQWKKDKTNKDYLREMRKTNLFQSFREVTRMFERIWYGQVDFSESDYQKVKPKFEALVKAAQHQKA